MDAVYNSLGLPIPLPVVLFKDGAACTDIDVVIDDGGVEAHKAAKPKAWTRWRRENGRVQLMRAAGWKNIQFAHEYPPLSKGFALNGTFKSVTGASTPIIVGNELGSAVSIREGTISFSSDGRFSLGSTTGFASPGAVAGQTSAEQQGTYEIDGYVVRFRFADGREGIASFVHDPVGDPGAVWMHGTGYSRQTR